MNRAACILLLLLACPGLVRADALSIPSGDAVARLLEADPRIVAAVAEVDAARARARAMRIGPHEFAVGVEGARRSIDGSDDVSEWNVGVSRRIRWPWKLSVAGDLGDVEIALAEARLDHAWRTAAQEFANTWQDWRLARDLARRAEDGEADALERVELQRRRLANGMGLELELDQLLSDAALATLTVEDAQRAERETFARLRGLFRTDGALELVPTPSEGLDATVEPMDQPASRIAHLESRRAILAAQWASRDRLPDPELGVFYFDELGGAETGVGASLSIPLGGRARGAEVEAARAEKVARIADADAAALRVRVASNELQRDVGSAERALAAAEEALTAARRAVERMQRGRDLDVVTMTELIVARRTLRATEVVAVQRAHALNRARVAWAIRVGAWPDPPVSRLPAPSSDE